MLQTTTLDVPEFAPDNDVGPVVTDMLNVLPDVPGGWKPNPKIFGTSSTATVSGRPLSGVTYSTVGGTDVFYFGTDTKLYKWDGANTITDLTRASGGDYDAVFTWEWEIFGDTLIAVNGRDEPQFIDLTSGTAFADLTGTGGTNPPTGAQFVAAVGGFLFFAKGSTIYWSGLEDINEWRPGTSGSDVQELPTGGPVNGLIGLEGALVIGQRNKLRGAQFNPGSPYVFSIQVIQENIGVRIPHSMTALRNSFAFIADDGFYVSNQAQAIGKGRVDVWFEDNIWKGSIGSEVDLICQAQPDNDNNLVVWSFPTPSSFNTWYGLAYDYLADKWCLLYTPSNSDIVMFAGKNFGFASKASQSRAFGFHRPGGTGDYVPGRFLTNPSTYQVTVSKYRIPAPGQVNIQYIKSLDDVDISDGETFSVSAQAYSGQVASGGSATSYSVTASTSSGGKAWVRSWGEKFDLTFNNDTGNFKQYEIAVRKSGNR